MSLKQTPKNFWSRVKRAGKNCCWDWQGAQTSTGYGNLVWHGVHVQAHRVAYWLTNGQISLTTGFRLPFVAQRYKRFVLHSCDNRLCCNPHHLFLGSMRANQLDAYRKGRKVQPKGQHHANAKLSMEGVIAIRKAYDGGKMLQVPLAKKYKVSQRVISLVVRRETYTEVK